MRKLIILSALLSATTAHAGYYERIPGPDGHYHMSADEERAMIDQQRHNDLLQELNRPRDCRGVMNGPFYRGTCD